MTVYIDYSDYIGLKPDGLTRDEFEKVLPETVAFLDRYTHLRARMAEGQARQQVIVTACAVADAIAKGTGDRAIEAIARERLRGTGLNGAL